MKSKLDFALSRFCLAVTVVLALGNARAVWADETCESYFRFYQPYTAASAQRYLDDFPWVKIREIPISKEVQEIPLPEGYRFNRAYQWNNDQTGTSQAIQFVISKDGKDVANVKFDYSAADRLLYISNVETVEAHQKNGLAKALFQASEIVTHRQARTIQFGMSESNYERILEAMAAGKNVEEALKSTGLGAYFYSSGYHLARFAPSNAMIRKYPDLNTEKIPKGYRDVNIPFFWLEKN
ncbi:hypothetical protein K2X30_10595 [bacterium]|nr:hypothetical protein [bacterium]